MTSFIAGECRTQTTLFPERLDDYVSEENPIRVIDVFIDELDLGLLGFKTVPEVTGRPAYDPSTLLKIYVYGYLNRVQSSRRLEREAQRNVELMWLTGRLAPDFKTIADFRRNSGRAIQKVCREFVLICRKLELFTDAFVAIDGSKFKAVNNRDRNFTQAKMKRRLQEVDESIARYLSQMESTDRLDDQQSKHQSERLKDKIENLRKEVKRLKELEKEMLASPDKQISLTDPDARSMKTRGTGLVGYNVQTAVDTQHHLIVTHEVTNVGNDRSALHSTATHAQKAIGEDKLDVVADRGYYSGQEILDCEQSQVTVFIPKSQTSGNRAKGLFGKRDFKWIAVDNEYECPAGERLRWRCYVKDREKTFSRYYSSKCPSCSIRKQCTTGKNRRVNRWEHEEVLDRVQARLDNKPESMRIRRQTVEHPFGTIKIWMGWTHFQMRTLKHVSTEMSLHVLSYNLKRAINIMGIKPLIAAIQA